jgi:hypothetical protein
MVPGPDPSSMAEWIHLLDPPRENFAATMSEEERPYQLGFLRGRD